VKSPRIKYTIRLPAELTRRLADHACARRASQTAVVEAALESFLSPDGAERLEAALARRLDHLSRQLDRAAWNLDLSNETLALFIRFWLTSTAPLPDTAMKAAQTMGKKRWERFIDSLTKRMEVGQRLRREVGSDVPPTDPRS
jgi:predicted transcriptional regulator